MVLGAYGTLWLFGVFGVNFGSPNTEPPIPVWKFPDTHLSHEKKPPGYLGYVGDSTIPKYKGMNEPGL